MCTNNTCNGKKNILINFTLRSLLLLLYSLLNVSVLQADETSSINETTISYETADTELTVSCFLTNSEAVIVFLPSVYAPFEEQESLAKEIAGKSLSTCFSHVFTDLFLPVESSYYRDIPLDHMLSLLTNIQRTTDKAVFLVAHGSGNKVAYRLASLVIQKGGQKNSALSGIILLSPNLLGDTPQPGKDQQYMSLVDQKTLPVFIFQPAYSPHHWHLDTLIGKIKKSGTHVRYQRLPDVRDGYALREDRTPKEQQLREQAAVLFNQAIQQLSGIQ
ncbi:MAG: hypothetical protein OQL16_05875 [Gammaproteobacteria bacterium]|nr:hypothetical protein [Gammaproteobacteria bacterium]